MYRQQKLKKNLQPEEDFQPDELMLCKHHIFKFLSFWRIRKEEFQKKNKPA